MPLVINNTDFEPSFDIRERAVLKRLLQLLYDQILAGLSLDDLIDVNATAPDIDNIISFDGSVWQSVSPYTTVTTVAGTDYTSLLTDTNSFLVFTNASPVTYTIAPQADVAWQDDAQIELVQYGTGQVTVVGGSGVSVNVESLLSTTTTGRYAVAGLKRIAEDEWVLFGHLEA